MSGVLLCSNCFKDQGLRLSACELGFKEDTFCPRCGSKEGIKLNRVLLIKLVEKFFVIGTIQRLNYGGAPLIRFNEQQDHNSDIKSYKWLESDIDLLEKTLKISFFCYGPKLWMIGEVDPLKSLLEEHERSKIIKLIIEKYPKKIFLNSRLFYRLRKNPEHPANFNEYDSPPVEFLGTNRLDSVVLPVMYGSEDLEVCVHECRATVEDNLFFATLFPRRDLRLLDLTELLYEEGTEFESLDMAIHMLFLAGKHSYEISRKIAQAAHKAHYDGLIYPSYFSFIKTGAVPFDTRYGISIRKLKSYQEQAKSQIISNIGLFGRPIKEGLVEIRGINRLILSKVKYDIIFGPVEC